MAKLLLLNGKIHFSSSSSYYSLSLSLSPSVKLKMKKEALIYVTRWCGGGGLVSNRAVEAVVVAVVVENDRCCWRWRLLSRCL